VWPGGWIDRGGVRQLAPPPAGKERFFYNDDEVGKTAVGRCFAALAVMGPLRREDASPTL
jgi:hypothetical protein